ncbi:Uncharacterised protein [Kingella potus]|uniref:PD-(D/E)XK nuclease superfamily n=1 Tax=Kingella potus TaxID=265175 RepID=A0A377QZS4_9NEIS|nr:PD-(D/E)XK nuclease family protein [Kingella potus]UOP00840.1 PD-(D/E)XK nuclease family protein [Kingella potus]STR00482.1 Uncharacterised protein [Kingella potus]
MENIKIYEGLRKLKRQIEAMRLEKAKTELYDANRFNPFRFMETDETGLSRILAFLLDSNEAHGQRDLFVRSFLQYLQLPEFLAYEKISVTTEKPLKNSARRHDIFLEAFIGGRPVWVMSIENKLRGASDQLHQMKDYWADLQSYKAENPDIYCYILYLPAQESHPTEESMKKADWLELQINQQAKIFSVRDMLRWLEQTPIVAPSIQNFINQFKQFLSEEIMGLSSNSNELITKIISDPDMLLAATTISGNTEELYEQLLQILDKQLQDKWEKECADLIAKGWKYDREGNFSNRYLYIGFNAPESEHFGIGIEFNHNWFQDAYYGVWAHKENIDIDKYQALQEKFADFISHSKQTKWWLGWTWLEGELCTWQTDAWLQVPTGQLADQIFDKLKPLMEIARTIED